MGELYRTMIGRGVARGVLNARPQIHTLPQRPSGPVVVTGTGGGAPAAKARPSIIVKQTVKQIQAKDNAVRKKRVTRATKQSRKKKLMEYNALKAKMKKSIMAGKKAHYSLENTRIKKLPSKERVAERKKIKSELQKRKNDLLKQMPAGGRLSREDLISLISTVKKIKW